MADYNSAYTGPEIDEAVAAARNLGDVVRQPDIADVVRQPDIADMVESTDVANIVKITQAAYDLLSPPDANTLYLIVG